MSITRDGQYSLELLSSPQVLGVAESLCRPEILCRPMSQCGLPSSRGDGGAIQEVASGRGASTRSPHLQFRSVPRPLLITDAGALRVIPKHATPKAGYLRSYRQWGWNPPGVISLKMQPGDVLLHDVMVVHGSEQKLRGERLAMAPIYYKAPCGWRNLHRWSMGSQWIDRRLRLPPLGLATLSASLPVKISFNGEWQSIPTFRTGGGGTGPGFVRHGHTWQVPTVVPVMLANPLYTPP